MSINQKDSTTDFIVLYTMSVINLYDQITELLLGRKHVVPVPFVSYICTIYFSSHAVSVSPFQSNSSVVDDFCLYPINVNLYCFRYMLEPELRLYMHQILFIFPLHFPFDEECNYTKALPLFTLYGRKLDSMYSCTTNGLGSSKITKH